MKWLERKLSGHIRIGPVVIFGFNAMHIAINIKTRRWGYICFHPTVRVFGRWWPWYFYLSPNATPWASTFAIGPGVSPADKLMSVIRRRIFGHGFTYGDDFVDWNVGLRDHLQHLYFLNRIPPEGKQRKLAEES